VEIVKNREKRKLGENENGFHGEIGKWENISKMTSLHHFLECIRFFS
jgi:hypothetical protein